MKRARRPPKYIITDEGSQFRDEYRAWCKRRGVRSRYGAVGKYGSISLIERFILTLKSEGLRRILVPVVPEDAAAASHAGQAPACSNLRPQRSQNFCRRFYRRGVAASSGAINSSLGK